MLSIKKYARATAFLVSLFLSNMLNAACPTAGALVLVDSEAAISNGSELAFSPDGNYLALSSFDNDVRVYSVSPAGALNVIQTVAAPTANYIEYAPNGLHVAITDSLANLLTVFDVNLATGTLSNPVNYGVAAGLDFPNSLIYSPSGDFVTVSNFNANFVSVFTANKQTGALSFVNNFTGAPVLNGPISVACSPDGLFVAVAYAFSDTVRVFSVNQVTGALTQIVGSDVATLARPNFLAYSPDGRFAAVAHTNASFVRVYAVNQTTGVFSFLQDVVSIPAGGALDYAPDGKFATVVSSTTNQATVYSVDPVTGLFTPLQNPLTIGSVSEAVVYSPNGKFAAISNRLANTVSLYATNATATANDQTIPMISCNSAVSFMVDACGVGIHIISTTDPIGGSVAIIGDTELEFIPDANFSGSTSFTYTVEDDLGNTATATITITVSSGPSAAITASTTTICQGSATTIALTITGGTPPYTIEWSDGVSGATSRTVSTTDTTGYFATVTDANGCFAISNTITITVNDTPTITISATPTEICSGSGSVVTLTAIVNGIPSPATVTWSDGIVSSVPSSGVATRTVSPLTTTIYSATTSNSCGSGNSNTFTVTVNQLPQVSSFVAMPSSVCLGESSTLVLSFTETASPFVISWSDGVTQTVTSSPAVRTVTPTTDTTYFAVITDNNGCEFTSPSLSVAVNNIPKVVLSSACDSICSGDLAILTLTLAGTAPFTINWSDGTSQTTSSAVVTHTVGPSSTTSYFADVTDSNGCTTTSNTITITVNALPTATLAASPVTICSGDSTTLTLVMSGTSPFDVSWSDGVIETNVNSPVVRSVAPTTTTSYFATVVDANGCQITSNIVTVSVNPSPTSATLAVSQATICSGGSSTLITTIMGGTAPYTVTYLDGFSQAGSSPLVRVVSPTTTTTYSITSIVDANGCSPITLPTPVTIAVNQPPTSATLKVLPATICSGGSSTLTTTVTDGTAPYTVMFSDGFSQTGSSPLARIVAPTTTTAYSITSIVDANGCLLAALPASVTVAVSPSPSSATLTVSPNAICSGRDSTLTTTVTGGTAPYTVTYLDGFSQTGSSPLAREVHPITTTTYTITSIVDANGCQPTVLPSPVTVIVGTSPTSAKFVASSTTICSGSSSTLKTTITGGTPPYTVTYSDGFTQKDNSPVTRVVSPTVTTTYTITSIVDANGCSLVVLPESITITVNPKPVASLASSSSNICSSGSVTLTLTITGSGPFNVKWSDGFMQTSVTSPVTRTVFPTTATSYSAIVTDSNGCEAISNTVMVDFDTQSILTAQPAQICIGGSSTLTLVVMVGTAPFDIVWSDGFTQTGVSSPVTRVVSPTATTTYSAKVTDSNGCSGNSNLATVSVSAAIPSETLIASRTTICSGESIALTLDITGGGPFIVNWSDGISQTSDTTPVIRQVAPTATTSYFATVTNACGSSVSPEVTVTVNPVPIAKLTASEVAICPRAFATLTLSVVGQGPFTVKWSDGVVQAGVTSPVIRTVSPIETTNYAARIIDRNGCEDLSNPVTVRVDSTLAGILAASPNPICAGISSILTLDIVGKAPFTIRWSDGVVQKTRQSTITRTITPSDTTLYTANITDGSGCKTASNNVTVLVNKLPHVTLSASKTRITSGEVVTLTAVPSGNAPFTLEWSDGFVQRNVTGITTRQVAPSVTTTYNLTIIDRNGCRFDPPKGVTVFVDQFTKVSLISKAIINKYC